MVMQSALRAWAKTAGCLGIVLLPWSASAADTAAQVNAVQPISTIKPVMAPPVALPKPDLPPVMTRPITPAPIAIPPVRTDPIRISKPDVSRPPGATQPPLNPLPLNPISRSDGPAGDGVSPDLSAAMIEYQKQINKEAREDRKLRRELKQLRLEAKREKLKRDNESIRAGRDEASKKADNAMNAAHLEMVTGVVSGAQQVGAGAGSVGGKTASGINADRIGTKRDKLDPIRGAKEETGDVESQVQRVLLETDKQNRSDLRQQMKEVKDANARKKALRDTGKNGDGTQGTGGGKGDKTIAATPVKAVGTAPPKTSLISRPCTPINPC